jgi:hypothetical protein
VWIYCNHPFLQTEQLANRIAMRLVTRERLEEVYLKLWGPGSMKGSLASFLGLPFASAEVASSQARRPAEPAATSSSIR